MLCCMRLNLDSGWPQCLRFVYVSFTVFEGFAQKQILESPRV